MKWPGSFRMSGGRSTSRTTISSRPAKSATISAVRSSFRPCIDAGDIYKGVYTGHYCTGCETFKTEKEVEEGGGRCPNHPNTPLSWVEEENYFFRLSAYRDRLLAHYESHPDFIQPASRRNEIHNLVDTELRDVAITRKGFTWGIKVPFDPDSDDLRLVRRLAQLHHRRSATEPTKLVSDSTGRRTCTSSARTSPASIAHSGRRC